MVCAVAALVALEMLFTRVDVDVLVKLMVQVTLEGAFGATERRVGFICHSVYV